ncbi:MAG: hypothetical protein KF764_08715 [Labilithrix sp.]|nr:hypothetical protein [Labilithrix sp.]
MPGGHRGAVLDGHQATILDDERARRVRKFVAAVGLDRACQRLGVSRGTLLAACGQSRLRAPTAERLWTALERVERAA